MRLAIALTACSRPDYLRQVLQSLAANEGLTAFEHLFIGLEPVNNAVEHICRSVNFIPTTVHKNKYQLGVRANPHTLLMSVFNAGYDGVFYMEDDVLLSPDAVRLAYDYARQPLTAERCLCLYNPHSTELTQPELVRRGVPCAGNFNSLDLFIHRQHWLEFFAPVWFRSPRGWDWSIVENGAAETIAMPAVSRSHHIGRHGGVHYVARIHDAMYVNNKYWASASPPTYAYTT